MLEKRFAAPKLITVRVSETIHSEIWEPSSEAQTSQKFANPTVLYLYYHGGTPGLPSDWHILFILVYKFKCFIKLEPKRAKILM
jgi:hypothetical protein